MGGEKKTRAKGSTPRPTAVAGGTQTTAEEQLLLVATNKQQREQLLLVAPDNSRRHMQRAHVRARGAPQGPLLLLGAPRQTAEKAAAAGMVAPGNSCDDI